MRTSSTNVRKKAFARFFLDWRTLYLHQQRNYKKKSSKTYLWM